MAIVIPGWGKDLGTALAGMGDAVKDIINPNYEAQVAMRKQVAANPELMQQLADAEYQNPGTLARFGFANMGDAAAHAMPSTGAVLDKILRPAIEAGAADPEIQKDIVSQKLTGKSTAGRQIEQNQAVTTGADAKAAPSIAAAKIAQADMDLETINTARQIIKDGPDITLKKLLNNEYTPAQLNAIFSTPMGQAFNFQLQAQQEETRLRVMKFNRGEDLERMKNNNAFEFMMRTKVNDYNAVYRFLYEPGAKEKAAELTTKDYAKLSEEDRGLVDAYNGINRLNTQQRNEQVQRSNKDVVSQVIAFKNIKPGDTNDDQRELIANTINQTLEERAAYGAPKFSVKYEQVVKTRLGVDLLRGDQKELVFRNEQGKIVSEREALNPPLVPDRPQKPTIPQPLLDRAVADVRGAKDRAAALKALHDANPDVYPEVVKELAKNP